jgi:hypothetical protein
VAKQQKNAIFGWVQRAGLVLGLVLLFFSTLLESQPDTPFLSPIKTLLTGPELRVTSVMAVSQVRRGLKLHTCLYLNDVWRSWVG